MVPTSGGRVFTLYLPDVHSRWRLLVPDRRRPVGCDWFGYRKEDEDVRHCFGVHRGAAWVVILITLATLAVDILFYGTRWAPAWLNPEGEVRPWQGSWHLPVIVSIILSASAGAAWYGVVGLLEGRGRLAARYLSYLFIWMAVDDFLAVHEKIERFSGVDWLVIYAPLMLTAAICGCHVIAHTRGVPDTEPFRRLAYLGAFSWFLSQVLEGIGQFWDDAKYHAMELIVPEEMLETLGSGALALSGWCLAAALARRR